MRVKLNFGCLCRHDTTRKIITLRFVAEHFTVQAPNGHVIEIAPGEGLLKPNSQYGVVGRRERPGFAALHRQCHNVTLRSALHNNRSLAQTRLDNVRLNEFGLGKGFRQAPRFF